MKILVRVLVALLLLPMAALPDAGTQEKKKYSVLFVTQSKGFRHGSVNRRKNPLAPSEVSVIALGKESGLFEAECTQDASIITPSKLRDVDLVMFYTTGQLPIDEENYAAFDAWLKNGGAFVGTHSATDTYKRFVPYHRMINGTFAGHPWGSGSTVTLAVHEPSHPTVKMLGEEFVIRDEIYQYVNYDPGAVRVLYSLDMSKCKKKKPYHVPVCWVREYGKGRMFYTNLGHNEGTWKNPKFKEHLLAGFRWALKLVDGPAEPNPEVQALEDAKSFVAAKAAENGKSGTALAAAAAAYAKSNAGWLKEFTAVCAGLRRSDRSKEERRTAMLEALYKELEKSAR